MKLLNALSPISNFMGKNKNPADAAMPYLNKIEGMSRENYNPYITQGREAAGIAQPQYNRMTEDPMGFLNEIMRGYKPSEGFNFRKEQALKGLGNAAAAGGYRGTEADQIANADLINRMLGEGQNEYLDQVLRLLGGGLQGQENAMTRGFGASGSLTDALANTYGAQGGLAYKDVENKNATRNQWMKTLLQLAGTAAGGAIGGPAGASVGASLGGALGGGGASNSQQFGSNLYSGRMV